MGDRERLEPLAMRDILRRGSQIYQRSFLQLMIVSAVTYAPLALLALSIDMESIPLNAGVRDGKVLVASQDALDRMALVWQITWIATALGAIVSMASLHHAVANSYLRRERNWQGSIREGVSRIPAILGMALVLGAMFLAPPFLLGVVAGSSGGSDALGVAMVLAFIAWVVGVTVLGSIAMPAMMRERIGPIAALGRARELLRGRWIATLGLLLVSGLAVGMGWGITFAAVRGALTANTISADRFVGGTLLAQMIASIVFVPLAVAVMTVAYFDLRIRSEDYDATTHDRETVESGGTPVMRPVIAASAGAMVARPRPDSPSPASSDAHPPRAIREPGQVPVRGPRWAEPLGPPSRAEHEPSLTPRG